MAYNPQINIPTPIGHVALAFDQVSSFLPDERGGVVIVLNEKTGDVNLEIISGYPYGAFKEWFEANKL